MSSFVHPLQGCVNDHTEREKSSKLALVRIYSFNPSPGLIRVAEWKSSDLSFNALITDEKIRSPLANALNRLSVNHGVGGSSDDAAIFYRHPVSLLLEIFFISRGMRQSVGSCSL